MTPVPADRAARPARGSSPDLAAFVAARWAVLVRAARALGAPPDVAVDVATDAVSRLARTWRRSGEHGDPGAEALDLVVAAWDDVRRTPWWEHATGADTGTTTSVFAPVVDPLPLRPRSTRSTSWARASVRCSWWPASARSATSPWPAWPTPSPPVTGPRCAPRPSSPRRRRRPRSPPRAGSVAVAPDDGWCPASWSQRSSWPSPPRSRGGQPASRRPTRPPCPTSRPGPAPRAG